MTTTPPAPEPRPERVQLGDLCGTVDDSDLPMCMSCDLATDRLRGGLPNLEHARCVATWVADASPAEILRAAAEKLRAFPGRAAAPLADLLDDLADGDDHGVVNPLALTAARAVLGVPAPQSGPVAATAPRSAPGGVSDPASPERAAHGRTTAPGRCDDCGHIEHPPRQCPLTLYGQRCACGEPITAQRHHCAHCGREIENRAEPTMGWPTRDHWVHVDGSSHICHPERGADSPRATPN